MAKSSGFPAAAGVSDTAGQASGMRCPCGRSAPPGLTAEQRLPVGSRRVRAGVWAEQPGSVTPRVTREGAPRAHRGRASCPSLPFTITTYHQNEDNTKQTNKLISQSSCGRVDGGNVCAGQWWHWQIQNLALSGALQCLIFSSIMAVSLGMSDQPGLPCCAAMPWPAPFLAPRYPSHHPGSAGRNA